MFVGILKTDNGPHPADHWARLTASQVITIASTAPDILLREATAFEAKLIDVLTQAHHHAQLSERKALKAGPERLMEEIETAEFIYPVLDKINALAKGTSFQAHFEKPETQKYLELLLHEHFHHSLHIERSWIADKSDHPAAKAFKHEKTDGRIGAYAGPAPSRKETH